MGFVAKLFASIYGPSFYGSMPRRSGGGAFAYFLFLTLLLSALYTLSVVPVATQFAQAARSGVEGVVSRFPQQLQVRIAGGRVSTNVPEPFVVPDPSSASGKPRNLLVIDTKTPYSAAQFRRYDTDFWVTGDSVVTDNDGKVDVTDLSSVPDVTIDQPLLRGLAASLAPWLALIAPIVLVGGFFLIWFTYLVRLPYLVLFALVILLVARICGQRWSYGVAFKAGLYAMTLPLLVVTAVPLASATTGFNSFTFMFSLLTVLVLFANLLPLRVMAPAEAPAQT